MHLWAMKAEQARIEASADVAERVVWSKACSSSTMEYKVMEINARHKKPI